MQIAEEFSKRLSICLVFSAYSVVVKQESYRALEILRGR